jgi:UDP-N-acetylmuramoyl-L-alanyl-D-glutamate--2,6-diaminopimelate ligase
VVPVRLADLAEALGLVVDVPDVEVTGLSMNSGSVRAGDLYAALPGARTHGIRFVPDAVAAGARAVLTDPAGAGAARAAGLPVLVAERPRTLVGRAASIVYGEPAAALTLVGVTGTQGKTTTTHLMNAALAATGRTTAVIGTMGTWLDGRPVKTVLTTPEAPDLHALFAVMRERGVDVCAMEVSSHALVMGRVDGVVFDLAVFTNLGRDHLDFHTDVEDYFGAKAALFAPPRTRRALVNIDDEYGARLVAEQRVPTSTFGLARPSDWSAEDVEADETGSSFVVTGPGGTRVPTSIALTGRFNVANALAALASVGELGLDLAAAAAGIGRVAAVPGRMERIPNARGITVVVDYAHKPDAVEASLTALRPVTRGRLIVVLGAGGDRDQGKRRFMGEIAGRLADVLVVTDDNPRTEDPAAIRAAILAGAEGGAADVCAIGDRRAAIAHALRSARRGDTVLIAGKGHETGQEVQDTVVPFDDREVAREVLDASVGPGGGPR